MKLLPKIDIQMRYVDGTQHMFLDGTDVSREIRLPEISMYASSCSAHPRVRTYLLEMQRELSRKQSVIMDGRDIGTVVLPQAEVKIFLTASPQVRAQRRYLELVARGLEKKYEEVLSEMIDRDNRDIHREASPLKKADDAVEVDTSALNFEEAKQVLLRVIKEKVE